jgi:hypothetical protein
MLSKDVILKLLTKYNKDLPKERKPERIQTLGNLELEVKINLTDLKKLDNILANILLNGVSKYTHRSERHHFFSDNNIGYGALILVEGSNEVWVKIKKDRNEIKTPTHGYTLLSRHEIKHGPQHDTYPEDFEDTIKQQYTGSFNKECIDLSFYYEDLSFTATLSLASAEEGVLNQIEFEYDGHKTGDSPPSLSTILEIFERMLITMCGDGVSQLNTHTKLDWLLSLS